MGGEIFCIVLAGMAVPQLFPVIVPKSDARMEQRGRMIVLNATFAVY
jgi:hypothetical protein